MKVLAFTLLAAFSCLVQANATTIWTNPITGTNPSSADPYTAGQTVVAHVSVSGIGRGSGINAATANNRYSASSWNTASFDPAAYFYFTLTPAAGFEISLTNFTYTGKAAAKGPMSFDFRSSADMYMANLGMPSSGGTTIDLSGAAFQNLTTPIQFRFYGFGATTAAAKFGINDFSFNGSVQPLVPVPEGFPVLPGLACVFALLVFARQLQNVPAPSLAPRRQR